MIIKQNEDYRYDINLKDSGIEIDMNGTWDKKSEQPCLKMLQYILNSKIEIKLHTKSLSTGNLFIEHHIQKKDVQEPSGILVTESDWWMFVIGDSSCQFYETRFLKYLYENRLVFGIDTKDNGYEQKYIGYGLIVPLTRIKELLNYWMEYQQEISLKKIREKLYTNK